ncbi:MAG: amidohydrolase [Ardenticatenales bacterium]|nr:amidohydrolase [Ardenticatenales bacterium]
MPNSPFHAEATALFPELVRLRRDFHRHPEVGFQERRTAAIIARALQEYGLVVRQGVGETGVVGLLEGARPGPTVLLRFDMDALPIQEENEVDYASQNEGVMHACGHDGHMAMGLALVRLFAHRREQMAGRLKFIFQPGEEGRGGALAMIADGVLDNPRADVAFAMHLWNTLPLGRVRVIEGPCMAASSTFTLTIKGKGGHGAAPHQSIDPVLAGAHIVAGMQSIVSRSVDPLESVVVTVGQFTAGTTFNVIPDQAILKGTVRSYEHEMHHMVYRRILEMAQYMAAAFRCTAHMETIAIVPAVVNAPEPTAIVRAAAASLVGTANVVGGRSMASEDMGLFLEEIPGCYFFVGSMNEEQGYHYPHHHPRFDFDERAMITGVATMAAAAAAYVLAENPEIFPEA